MKEDSNAELGRGEEAEEQAELEQGHELVNCVLEGVEVEEEVAEEEENGLAEAAYGMRHVECGKKRQSKAS